MLRISQALSLAALATSAVAQSGNHTLTPITAPVRDGGVYNLATGQWTRAKSSIAAIGTDIIYNNTCTTGFYSALQIGMTFSDEGRLPSLTSPDNLQSKPGCANSYTVNGFQFGYCTDQLAVDANITFLEEYPGCGTDPATITPLTAFALTGFPASASVGTLACWIITVDLEAPAQTTDLSFSILADGTGGFDGTTDLFGWRIEMPLTQGVDGPITAGDDSTCVRWGETIWDPAGQAAQTAGTGMGTLTSFRIDGGTVVPGCYIPVNSPIGSYFLELYSTDPCTGTGDPGVTAVCFGSAAACPCGATDQASTDGLGGCENSFGTGGTTLAITNGGSQPSVSVDTATPTVVTTATRGPTNPAPNLLFQGVNLNAPAAPFGDGLRCPGGAIIRCGVRVYGVDGPSGELSYPAGGYGATNNASLAVQGQIPAAGGTRYYQGWYRNNAPFCTTAVFNLTNAVEVVWVP